MRRWREEITQVNVYREHPEELYRVQPEEMYSAHEHPKEVCLGYDQQV